MLLTSTVVGELSEVCADLAVHFALWRQIRLPETYAEFSQAIEDLRELFDATADAHLQAALVAIYQLMDTRTDVLSFPNLLSTIRSTHPDVVASLEGRFDPHREILSNIEAIRSKVYAHRDRDLGPDMVFAAAPISPNSLGECVEVLLRIASDLCFALQLRDRPSALYDDVDGRVQLAIDQLHQVLRALSK